MPMHGPQTSPQEKSPQLTILVDTPPASSYILHPNENILTTFHTLRTYFQFENIGRS